MNISRADLYAIDVVDTLEGLVGTYGLDHSLLELEITESAYAEDRKMAEAVSRLKALGFTILMDDFGSGYSSLNMLKDITVDILKIDMGFLNNRISLAADWYKRDNHDLIGVINTQGIGGQIQKYGNVATMKSRGIEFSLSTKNIKTKDLFH